MKTQVLLLIFSAAAVSFITCNNDHFLNHSDPTTNPINIDTSKIYLQKGKEIAAQTFAVLSANLQKAMAKGGISHAIKYCNIEAEPLVDSLSQEYNAKIRRTSNQFRNPKNKPDSLESIILQTFTNRVDAGEKINPSLIKKENNAHSFFAPIMINSFCLNCHGKVGKSLSVENNELLKEIYPADLATGYKAGDLRGIWSIEFKQK